MFFNEFLQNFMPEIIFGIRARLISLILIIFSFLEFQWIIRGLYLFQVENNRKIT